MADPRLLPVDLAARRRLLRDDPRLWRRWLVAQTRGLEPARCEAACFDDPEHYIRWVDELITDRVDHYRLVGRGSYRRSALKWSRSDPRMPLP